MVSIIIPTYNRYGSLVNAINSIKAQTFKDFEILVINDCSTDDRYNKTDWAGMGVEYYCTEKNVHNPVNARNIGITEAKNKFITFLDDDDMWLPDKLEKQLAFMQAGRYMLTYTEGFYSDMDSVYNPKQAYLKYLSEKFGRVICAKFGWAEIPTEITKDIIKKHNIMITSSVMIHMDLVNKVGLFEKEPTMPKWEDWAYWIRCLEYTNCYFLKTPLVFYNDAPRNKYILR